MQRWVKISMVLICPALVTNALAAQELDDIDKMAIKVQKQTLMERFEPEMVATAAERIALKEKHLEERQRARMLLDTLDISERKRRKLMKDLKTSPFSDRLTKTMANAKFEEGE